MFVLVNLWGGECCVFGESLRWWMFVLVNLWGGECLLWWISEVVKVCFGVTGFLVCSEQHYSCNHCDCIATWRQDSFHPHFLSSRQHSCNEATSDSVTHTCVNLTSSNNWNALSAAKCLHKSFKWNIQQYLAIPYPVLKSNGPSWARISRTLRYVALLNFRFDWCTHSPLLFISTGKEDVIPQLDCLSTRKRAKLSALPKPFNFQRWRWSISLKRYCSPIWGLVVLFLLSTSLMNWLI